MKMTRKSRKALAEVNYDLFHPVVSRSVENERSRAFRPGEEGKTSSLPALPELYAMFDNLNFQYFDGRLPRPKISYSARMLIAGTFTPPKNEIRIGRKYHEVFPDEIEDTMKHEMIHIIHPRHDRKFKAVARRIGASLKARTHPSLQGNHKYLYTCPHCGQEYPRQKRLRMAYCGVCARGGRFDAEFKLKLLRSKKNS